MQKLNNNNNNNNSYNTTSILPGDTLLEVVDLRLDDSHLLRSLVALELQCNDLVLEGLHHDGDAAEVDLRVHPLRHDQAQQGSQGQREDTAENYRPEAAFLM